MVRAMGVFTRCVSTLAALAKTLLSTLHKDETCHSSAGRQPAGLAGRPVPFAGVIRIRFDGLACKASQQTAPQRSGKVTMNSCSALAAPAHRAGWVDKPPPRLLRAPWSSKLSSMSRLGNALTPWGTDSVGADSVGTGSVGTGSVGTESMGTSVLSVPCWKAAQ